MTVALVVDASAMITLLRGEPGADAVREILTERRQDGGSLSVPSGFWLEVVNSLVRRHRMSSAEVMEAFVEMDAFGLSTVELDRPLVLVALDLAERFGLTSYDASYLAVAIALRADLLTLDDELARAAGVRAAAIGRSRLHETPAVYEHDVTWPSYKGASAYLSSLRAQAIAGREAARSS